MISKKEKQETLETGFLMETVEVNISLKGHENE